MDSKNCQENINDSEESPHSQQMWTFSSFYKTQTCPPVAEEQDQPYQVDRYPHVKRNKPSLWFTNSGPYGTQVP